MRMISSCVIPVSPSQAQPRTCQFRQKDMREFSFRWRVKRSPLPTTGAGVLVVLA
jgi:hypothetical protein